MQVTPAPSAQSIELMTERVKANRKTLVAARARMVTARAASEDAYHRSCQLRDELRQKLENLAEAVAVARRDHRVAMRPPDPVLPRYSPDPPDPLDVPRTNVWRTMSLRRFRALTAASPLLARW